MNSSGKEVMSKVYEALKKAQEERSLVGQQIENEKDSLGSEGPQPATILTPASPNVLTRAPIVGAPASVIPHLGHLPHAPAGNRVLKTGQFLRFEDLLKNCPTPASVCDTRSVVFSAYSWQRSA